MVDKTSLRVLVGYDLDKSSLNAVVSANQALAASSQAAVNAVNTPAIKALNNDFASLSPRVQAARKDIDDLRAGINDYAAGIDTVDSATRRWDGDLTSLRNSIKGVKDATSGGLGDVTGGSVGAVGGGGGGTGSGTAITQFGSKLRGLPSIQIPGLGIGTDAIANIIRMAGALNQAAQAVPGVTAATELLTPAIGVTAASLAAMLIPVAAVAVAVAPLIIAFKILADREAEAAKSAKLLADVYASQADAFAVGQRALQDRNEETKKSAVELFNSINESFRTNAEKIQFLNNQKATSDQKTADEIQKTIDATVEEQIKLSGSIDILRGNLQQLGVQIDGTAPGLSKVGDGTNNFFTAILGALTKLGNEAGAKLAPIGDAITKFVEEAKKKADKEVSIVDKLNKDLAAIDAKGAADRVAIGQKLADDLISINAKAAENAQKILDDLKERQAASALKLSRDNENAAERANFNSLTRQIAFQREEVAARKRHELDLKQLREDAADQEFSDGLDRNFAAIAQGRRDLQRAISRSNENFNAEEQARLDSFNQKNEDASRQFAFEHEQRLQAYAQESADQIAAANAALKKNETDRRRARLLAQIAANQDYADLNNKIANERAVKTSAAIADLQLVIQTQDVIKQAYASTLAQAQALLNSVQNGTNNANGGGGTSATPTPNLRGSGLRVGGFPTRSPLFAGAGGGSTSNSAVTVSIPVTVVGGDPATIERTMTKVARNVVADTVERMNRR